MSPTHITPSTPQKVMRVTNVFSFLSLLCSTNIQLTNCVYVVLYLATLCYGLRTGPCGHSFVHCLGAAKRVRLAGSRQLVWNTAERTVSFWQANSTRRFNYRASLHILFPVYIHHIYTYKTVRTMKTTFHHTNFMKLLLTVIYFLRGVTTGTNRSPAICSTEPRYVLLSSYDNGTMFSLQTLRHRSWLPPL